MEHNGFTCSPHASPDCACEPRDDYICNPYWLNALDPEYGEYACPTWGEGEDCTRKVDSTVED